MNCFNRHLTFLIPQHKLISAEGFFCFLGIVSAKAQMKKAAREEVYDAAQKGLTKDAAEGIMGAGTTVLKPQNLVDELSKSGVKYNADDVVMVTKAADGKLMWLEKGNDSSGLKHITDGHAVDFSNRGISDIPEFLNRVLQKKPIKTDATKAGPYAEYLIDGKRYRVVYGTNVYIVSFYPIYD